MTISRTLVVDSYREFRRRRRHAGFADDAELLIDSAVVDFDDHAVSVEGQGLAIVGKAGDFLLPTSSMVL